ncbi:MAG: hypothetical protein ACKO6N_00485 [Myxococcota bacterium]
MKHHIHTSCLYRDLPPVAQASLGMAVTLALVLPAPTQASTSEAYFRVQIKKINQYLDDTFCQDALLLALETQQKEGGKPCLSSGRALPSPSSVLAGFPRPWRCWMKPSG